MFGSIKILDVSDTPAVDGAGNHSVSTTATVGQTYAISVRAYVTGIIYATGTASVTVVAGQNSVTVPMKEAWTVTLDFDNTVDPIENQYIANGERAVAPSPPTHPSGDAFTAWMLGPGFAAPWDFTNDTVTESITLKAIYTPVGSFTIIFNPNGGTGGPTPQIVSGGAYTPPASPTPTRGIFWTFDGWYKEAACTSAWTGSDTVTGNVTLYAKWNWAWTVIPAGTGSGQSGFTTLINSIAYGGGKFVAVGTNGVMAHSSDGVSWNTVADSTFGTLNILDIAYGSGVFVAVGTGGRMAYSSDGITWTPIPAGPG
jgi:uncharacterized repeat protein (TIGR02543 family)